MITNIMGNFNSEQIIDSGVLPFKMPERTSPTLTSSTRHIGSAHLITIAMSATILDPWPPLLCKHITIDSRPLHNFQIKAETGKIYDYTSPVVL